MKLSIIIPAYNEEKTVAEIIRRVFEAPAEGFEKEIIVVNDGSTDSTLSELAKIRKNIPFILLEHSKNKGKGASIRTGIFKVTGDAVLIQDADFELSPDDYPNLLSLFVLGAPIVYGSRNLEKRNFIHQRRVYALGGKFITGVFNLLYGTRLTDINTAYKLFRCDVIKSIRLQGNGFEFCEEVTAKLVRLGYPVKEVSVRYTPRTFLEGKKLRAKDGIIALWTILKYRFSRKDDFDARRREENR